MNRWLLPVLLGLSWPLVALAEGGMSMGQDGMDRQMMPPDSTMMPAAPDREGKIRSAMSAAPPNVSGQATVLDWPADPKAKPATLRTGSNGWTCLPDNPGTPGNDPMCLDKQWMSWVQAYMSHGKPKITGVGMAYMLQGGTDASNTDPFAEKPAPGEQWMKAPPHLMVISPAKWDKAMYSSDMGSGRPWVMFPGTPYEHLMVPLE